MCTIGRISGGTARETYHCGNRKEGALRHGKKETDCGTQRCRNSFLNATFLPISPSELFTDGTDGKPHNLITQENYEYLRDSFFRYALLLKKEAVHTPGRTPGESIARLHEEMCNLVGNDMNVNIEQDEERLLFRLWKCHEWGELTLYYFPTKFMERLGPELRRISVTFIHNLMQANGINTVLDEDDMDYALTLMSEDDSGETASDRKKRRRLLHSYEEGRIHALLRRVERKSYYKNLPKAIDRYKPKDGYEQSLLSVMKEGLEFLTPEHGIMEYGYDPFYEEEPDFLPMYLSKQIRELVIAGKHLDHDRVGKVGHGKHDDCLFVPDLTGIKADHLSPESNLTHLSGNCLQLDRHIVKVPSIDYVRVIGALERIIPTHKASLATFEPTGLSCKFLLFRSLRFLLFLFILRT